MFKHSELYLNDAILGSTWASDGQHRASALPNGYLVQRNARVDSNTWSQRITELQSVNISYLYTNNKKPKKKMVNLTMPLGAYNIY